AARLTVAESGIGLVIGLATVIQAGARTAIQHRELAVEPLHDHLGRVALLAGLVLPVACLQFPLDVDLRTFAQILLRDLAQVLVENHDRVPLRPLPALASGLVTPALARRHPQVDNWPTILRAANLRIPAEI